MLNKKILKYTFSILILTSLIFCNSRIAFSRPNSFLRTPSDLTGNDFNRFYVGASMEMINTTNLNYSRSINYYSSTAGKFDYGFNYLTHATYNIDDDSPPSEFLFHFTKEIYRYNNLVINIGVHDIPITSEIDDAKPSLFLSFINKNIRIGKKYLLQSAVGFGTEKINEDSHSTDSTIEKENNANLFCGFQLTTPWRSHKGEGVGIMAEYIDKGYHLGFDMPINHNIRLQFALTHIENFKNFNEYDDSAGAIDEQIFGNDTGISIGIEYQIPTKKNQHKLSDVELGKVQIAEPENNCYIGLVKGNMISPLQVNEGCSVGAIKQIVKEINTSFQTLNDSITMLDQTLTAHELTKNALEIKVNYLQDSLSTQEIKYHITKTELNIAIKSLTNSLKYYYTNEYHLALKELDKTIKYLPNLAAAYARKGSIYYKLGELDRATINWNRALQLDPEYEEVKNILLKIKSNSIGSNTVLPE